MRRSFTLQIFLRGVLNTHICVHTIDRWSQFMLGFTGFMQFVVKEVSDQQTTLLDNALRIVYQLLNAWRNAIDKVATAKPHDTTRHDPNRPDLATTLHMSEGFALVIFFAAMGIRFSYFLLHFRQCGGQSGRDSKPRPPDHELSCHDWPLI